MKRIIFLVFVSCCLSTSLYAQNVGEIDVPAVPTGGPCFNFVQTPCSELIGLENEACSSIPCIDDGIGTGIELWRCPFSSSSEATDRSVWGTTPNNGAGTQSYGLGSTKRCKETFECMCEEAGFCQKGNSTGESDPFVDTTSNGPFSVVCTFTEIGP